MKKVFFMAVAAVVLAMPSMAQEEDWHYTQDWIPTGLYTPSAEAVASIKAAPTPKNMSEAIAKMPAVPTVDQIYTIEAKEIAIRTIYEPYQKALYAALEKNGQESRDVDRRIKVAGEKQKKSSQKAMDQYQSNVNAGLMPSQEEMMALYMSGEITENMSEAQMMDVMAGHFAAKWGISKQEYLKIMNMAQSNPKGAEAYIKSNHPDLYKRLYAANAQYGDSNVHPDDPRVPEFNRINDELLAAQDEIQAVFEYMPNTVYTQKAGEYGNLFQQMENEWDNSPEAKQIEAIQEALQKRLDAWYLTLDHNVKGDIPYPAWYTTERKKENALIDQWNRRWATKWLKLAQDSDKKLRPIFKRIADLDVENEQLGKQGDTEEFHYLTNKKLACTLYGYVLHVYSPVNDAIAFPAIEHVETTGFAIIEK